MVEQAKPENDYSPFRILKDHFKDQLRKYLSAINAPMTLIIEESLISVVFALLLPKPDNIDIKGTCKLRSDKVSFLSSLKLLKHL